MEGQVNRTSPGSETTQSETDPSELFGRSSLAIHQQSRRHFLGSDFSRDISGLQPAQLRSDRATQMPLRIAAVCDPSGCSSVTVPSQPTRGRSADLMG